MEGPGDFEKYLSNGFGSLSSLYQQRQQNRHYSTGAVGFYSEPPQPHRRDHSYEGLLTEFDLYNKMCTMSVRDESLNGFHVSGRSGSSRSCKGGNFPASTINVSPCSDNHLMRNNRGREINDSSIRPLFYQDPTINTYTAFGPYANGSGISSLSSSNNMFLSSHYTDLVQMREAQELQRRRESVYSSIFFNSPRPVWETQYRILTMATDQEGCRKLQKVVEEGSRREVQIIFDEIIVNIVELMRNQFANYLVQKLLEVCSEGQRMNIVLILSRDREKMITTCFDTHGTRVVQKLITSLKTKEQIASIRDALKPVFLDLVNDMNGSHVIKRCLEHFSNDDKQFIFESASQFCVEIATHQHGCCVLQHCIPNSSGNQRESLIAHIVSHALILAQDPFGNYVIQYIIDMKSSRAIPNLLAQLEGNFARLSLQKFSSHVVEKCIKELEESRSIIVHELLSVPRFSHLLQDPFANYVILSALNHTKVVPLRTALVCRIMQHHFLRTNPYCKKIFSHKLLRKSN